MAYTPKELNGWALQALHNGGYDVRRVLRVYQPKDSDDGDVAEVLWLEYPERACTSYMDPTGRIVVTVAGFG